MQGTFLLFASSLYTIFSEYIIRLGKYGMCYKSIAFIQGDSCDIIH